MRSRLGLLTLAAWLLSAGSAAALDARITEIRTIGPTIRASLDLQDVFSEKFRAFLQTGEALHVRIETELWEDRPLWDKLVRPAIVSAFRIIRDPNNEISVADAVGVVGTVTDLAAALPLRVEVAPADALNDRSKYYLRVIATVGTIAPGEAADTSDAVFGRDDSTISMARMGKLIFNTVVQVADYLQSVSAEVRSRVFDGRDVKAGIRQPHSN